MNKPYKPGSGPRPGKFDSDKGPPKQLPMPKTITYYRDGKLAPELMDKEAEAMAQRLAQVTTTQLRRFYEDVLNLRQRLPLEPQKAEAVFEELRADFKMLKAKAVYAYKRNEKNLPGEFLQFFIDHVHSVENARDFEAFCKHFQAVVAFHKFYEGRSA